MSQARGKRRRRRPFVPLLYIWQVSIAGLPLIFLVFAGPMDQKPDTYRFFIPVVGLLLLTNLGYLISVLRNEITGHLSPMDEAMFGKYPQTRYLFAVVIVTLVDLVGWYSWIYWTYGGVHSCFSEPLSKIDALYFTLTITSTVGLGDISPQSQFCRLLVSSQLLFTIFFVTIFLGLLVVLIARGTEARREQ